MEVLQHLDLKAKEALQNSIKTPLAYPVEMQLDKLRCVNDRYIGYHNGCIYLSLFLEARKAELNEQIQRQKQEQEEQRQT